MMHAGTIIELVVNVLNIIYIYKQRIFRGEFPYLDPLCVFFSIRDEVDRVFDERWHVIGSSNAPN